MNGPATSKILITDDHPLVREGLKVRINDQPDMVVCGEAASVAESLQLLKTSRPDLVIVDIVLAEGHGLDLIKQVKSRFPDVKMLVVTAADDVLYGERALRAGAHGYINKRECQEKIVEAIRVILAGQRYVGPELTQRLVESMVGGPGPATAERTARLSDRELEVFHLIGQGKTTTEIAKQLHLSVHTIDTHREKIRRKLGLSNATQLIRSAVQWVLEND
jgi:DNA-binding NarL/FixJ family response regulator